MLTVTDTFINYLATELAGQVPLKWVHASAEDVDSNVPSYNALNITVVGLDQQGSSEFVLVSLDLIGSNERTVYGWARLVTDKLLEFQYTPEMVFEPDPANPTATNRMVFWEPDDAKFNMIRAEDRYVHMNATLELQHVRQ